MNRSVVLTSIIAALALAPPAANAQRQPETVPRAENQPWCLQRAGTLECIYRTLAECNRDRLGEASGCAPNPRSTTGVGTPRGPKR